jgi:hypothetical protein
MHVEPRSKQCHFEGGSRLYKQQLALPLLRCSVAMTFSTMLGVSIRQQQRQDWNQTAWLYISNKPDTDRDYDLLLLLFLVLFGLL